SSFGEQPPNSVFAKLENTSNYNEEYENKIKELQYEIRKLKTELKVLKYNDEDELEKERINGLINYFDG
ncbi:hypothetical protein ACFLU5_16915, partial [Bacteroidota bacterium]